jgi:hypothetical protein
MPTRDTSDSSPTRLSPRILPTASANTLHQTLETLASRHIENWVPTVWEPSLTKEMDHFCDAGVAPNPDKNSGNPLGLTICPNTACKGERANPSDFLAGTPRNLRVVIDAQISRIGFEGRRAVGVETLDGRHSLLL